MNETINQVLKKRGQVKMNQELALKVVTYIAEHLGNLPDDSKPGFEIFTNDEIDAEIKCLKEKDILNIVQSEAYSYCGIGNVKGHDSYDKYFRSKAFISEEKLKEFKASLE